MIFRLMVAFLLIWFSVMSAAAAREDLSVGMQLEPPHLDPTSAAAGAIDQVLYANVYEGLTRFASNGSIIGALAADWDISPDGIEYIFKLHQNVRFHDGSAMDSEDVLFSLERARGKTSTNAQKGLFEPIADIIALGPNRVKIILKRPVGNFLFNLAWGDAVIVPSDNVDDLRIKAIGTGPFMVANWIKGDRIILKRHSGYWGAPPRLDQVVFRFLSDPNASYAAVLAGDIDAFPNFPAPENLSHFEKDQRFRIIRGTTEGETLLAINHGRAAFADHRVRKALALAINRHDIIEGAMFGYGTPIGSHFAPHHPDYIDLTALSPHDPKTAKALLAEAGYSEGLTLVLKLPPPVYARRSGEIIASQLKEVGITAKIIKLEWAQWLEEVFRNKDYDLTIVSHTEPFDIGIYARKDYYFQYDNSDFQALMTRLDQETDPQERSRLIIHAQRLIAEDYVNVFLFQLARAGVAREGIIGLWDNEPTQAIDVTDAAWRE